jgi:tRNA threonylcarbamoyladenosine biosynthesis protein TsaB
MLLAIDTATHWAGIALYAEDQVWGEESWHSAMKHTVELMPRVQRLLATHGVAVSSLAGIGVSLGPGSFTGLRIGLAAAKGMALPYRLPLVGIPTLDATAYPFRLAGQPVWAVIEAGRGRVGAACYDWSDGEWRQSVPATLTTFKGLCDLARQPAIFTGEIPERGARMLREQLGQAASIPPIALRLRRPTYLAELAHARLAQHDVDDAATLSPIYLQHPAMGS